MTTKITATPPSHVSRDTIVARSKAVLERPDSPINETEDIFRIEALGLEWDMGLQVYEPVDTSKIARGADGKVSFEFEARPDKPGRKTAATRRRLRDHR